MLRSGTSAVCAGIAAVALIVALSFGLWELRLSLMRRYGTEAESVKTDIYRENKAYVEGTVRDLRELRVTYQAAEDGHKDAIRSLILQRAGELDWDRLPSDLRIFLNEMAKDMVE